MVKFFRTFLSVLLGLLIGSAVNIGLIMISGKVIPPPAGADVTTMEGLKASLHLFEAKHFVFPFLAHALGTFVGAFIAGLLAPSRSTVPAYVVGGIFLLGGIANVIILPAPAWFSTLDLLVAYLPAAWLGQALVVRSRGARSSGT
jgi:hypothetical protein